MTVDRPPRPALPLEALLRLASIELSPEAFMFLQGCREEGFGLEQPGDEDLSDAEWRDAVTKRCRILVAAWQLHQEGWEPKRSNEEHKP